MPVPIAETADELIPLDWADHGHIKRTAYPVDEGLALWMPTLLPLLEWWRQEYEIAPAADKRVRFDSYDSRRLAALGVPVDHIHIIRSGETPDDYVWREIAQTLIGAHTPEDLKRLRGTTLRDYYGRRSPDLFDAAIMGYLRAQARNAPRLEIIQHELSRFGRLILPCGKIVLCAIFSFPGEMSLEEQAARVGEIGGGFRSVGHHALVGEQPAGLEAPPAGRHPSQRQRLADDGDIDVGIPGHGGERLEMPDQPRVDAGAAGGGARPAGAQIADAPGRQPVDGVGAVEGLQVRPAAGPPQPVAGKEAEERTGRPGAQEAGGGAAHQGPVGAPPDGQAEHVRPIKSVRLIEIGARARFVAKGPALLFRRPPARDQHLVNHQPVGKEPLVRRAQSRIQWLVNTAMLVILAALAGFALHMLLSGSEPLGLFRSFHDGVYSLQAWMGA